MSVTYRSNDQRAGAVPVDTVIKTTLTADGNVQHVNLDNFADLSALDGYKSTVNSTTDGGEAIAGGATWSGASDSPLNYGGVRVIVYSTQVSATNGLKIYCSENGTDWLLDDQYTIPANTVKTFTTTVAPYFKVTYTNGATPATLHVCTLFLKHMSVVSSHRVQDTLYDDDDGQLVVAIPKLRTAQNTYVSGSATALGNYKISLEEVNGVSVPVTASDDFTIDAFGRQRVSNTGQRVDVEFIYDLQPLIFDVVGVGGGSVAHQSATRDLLLSVGDTDSASVQKAVQHWHNPYTPGNGQLIDITGTLDNAGIGGGTAAIFLKNNGVETVINQADWDTPSLDVDWSFSQIFQIDFQSLKVGRLRYNLVRDGIPVNVHAIENDNRRSAGYWQYANLPLYWSIYNTTDNETVSELGYGDTDNGTGFRYTIATDATATMRAICGTVKSEDGYDLFEIPGFDFSASNGTTSITVDNTLTPVISIRVAPTFKEFTNRMVVIPETFSLQASNAIHYQLIYRGALSTDVVWVDTSTDYSGVQYDVTATEITGGIRIDEDYIASGVRNQPIKSDGSLGRVIMSLGNTGTPDVLTIAAIRTTASDSTTFGAIKWKEIR